VRLPVYYICIHAWFDAINDGDGGGDGGGGCVYTSTPIRSKGDAFPPRRRWIRAIIVSACRYPRSRPDSRALKPTTVMICRLGGART
jgi:hypothetical protein